MVQEESRIRVRQDTCDMRWQFANVQAEELTGCVTFVGKALTGHDPLPIYQVDRDNGNKF